MLFRYPITLRLVIKLSLKRVALTWLIVLAENVLMMLLPLFIGFAIDGLLEQNLRPLLTLGFILFALVVISVARRVYDTRVYGAIRVRLAKLVARNLRAVPISVKDARLTMSRETGGLSRATSARRDYRAGAVAGNFSHSRQLSFHSRPVRSGRGASHAIALHFVSSHLYSSQRHTQ